MLWVCNLTLSSPGLLDGSNTLPSTSSVLLETEGQDLWCTLLESALEVEAADCNHLQSLVTCRQRACCESQWVRNGCLAGAFILLYQGRSGKPSEMFSLAVLWIYNNLVLWVLLALDYIPFLMTQQIFIWCLQVHDMIQGVTGIAKIKTENAHAWTNWQFPSQLPLQTPTELGICPPLASCLHTLPLQQTPSCGILDHKQMSLLYSIIVPWEGKDSPAWQSHSHLSFSWNQHSSGLLGSGILAPQMMVVPL